MVPLGPAQRSQGEPSSPQVKALTTAAAQYSVTGEEGLAARSTCIRTIGGKFGLWEREGEYIKMIGHEIWGVLMP